MTGHEPVHKLLAELQRHEVSVWLDDGRLRCSGPEAALTQAVTQTLRDRKDEIVAFLDKGAAAEKSDGWAIMPQRSKSPPLSFAQQRLWFIEQMLPDAGLYHMPFAIEARGALDIAALEAALEKVATRHDVLRTRISTRDGEPLQRVVEHADIPLSIIDRSGRSPQDAEIEELIRADMRRPFDLAGEPPIRLTLLRLAPEHHLILLTLHHICSDGWSMEVLFTDLMLFYRRIVEGDAREPEALAVQYGDFAAWQRDHLQGDVLERSLDFWKQHLADLPTTRLPVDFQRPALQGNEAAHHEFEIDAATTARLRTLASAEGATPFAALFTAFNILLYRYCGQSDLVTGTPVANRQHRETERLIGLFVNPLPIRVRLLPAHGLAENLRRVQSTLWDVLEHQDLPFERLVEELRPDRDLSMNPLFQIKFQFDPQQRPTVDMPGLELTRLARRDGSNTLDLGLNLHEAGDVIKGAFAFDPALFQAGTISALASHFLNLLEAMLANPQMPIAALPLLSAAERQRQLVDWNATQKPYSALCFQQVFEAHAAQQPEAIALVHARQARAESCSYDALNRRANQIAHMLRGRGVGPESIVAIALERGFDMMAAWLGVLKAGGAWLPLDPSYPADRLAYMFEDSGARLVLTHSGMVLPSNAKRIDLDQDWPHDARDDNPECLNLPHHLAYVIYTSGSTGKPKGVLVEHAGLVNLTEDKIRVCDVRPGDCVLQFFSFSFDACIPELVMSLGAGASLLLLPADEALPGPALAGHMARQGVTHMTITPSALLALPEAEFPALRMVLVGGEAPQPDLIERWSRGRLFINAYGPTETTVNASMTHCGNGNPMDAVLLPSANKQLYVLDANMEPAPVGLPGELYIGGLGIARGYHASPALTAGRFLPDPFAPQGGVLYRTGDRASQLADGRIRVLGRLDHQVKVRGYRIEPGEIETVLLTHPDVAAAAVAVRDDSRGEKRIAAYAVARRTEPETPAGIYAWLGERLPRFMVPDVFIWLDALPLTVNGKADLAALPLPDLMRDGDGRAPTTATEKAVARAFEHILGIGTVNATDDFFRLGGHSLLATRLSAFARTELGLDIAVLDLFNAPGVEALAARLDARSAENASAEHDDEAMLHADTQLEADIVLSTPARAQSHPPGNVLLTGATGFFGTWLLAALLRRDDRDVWCLTRGADGAQRLRTALENSGLWDNAFASRLHAVNGDLAEPLLGLDPQRYAQLSGRIDAIVHNGALVHHLYSYQRLRAANVDSVREILRLACASGGCPVHHISSLSALTRHADGTPLRESDAIEGFAPPSGGYNRSKWAAEFLVAEASRRGLPVTIYRPGAISGDSVNGTFNAADILCRLMQGYLHSGLAPQGDAPLQMLPVDHAARIVATLIDRPDVAGKTFHLVHSTQVSSALLFEACALEGIDIRRVPADAWRDHVQRIARGEPNHPLYPLVGLFEQAATKGKSRSTSAVECSGTLAAMAETPFKEPPLGVELFRIYLRAFIRSGALPAKALQK